MERNISGVIMMNGIKETDQQLRKEYSAHCLSRDCVVAPAATMLEKAAISTHVCVSKDVSVGPQDGSAQLHGRGGC